MSLVAKVAVNMGKTVANKSRIVGSKVETLTNKLSNSVFSSGLSNLNKKVVKSSASAEKLFLEAKKAASGAKKAGVAIKYTEEGLKRWESGHKFQSVLEESHELLKSAIENNASQKIMSVRFENLKNISIRDIDILEKLISNKLTVEDRSLILDNTDLLKKIFASDKFNADFMNLIETVPIKKLFSETSNVANFPKGLKYKIIELLYKSKKHNIAFGNEIVKNDSSFILNLLTGRQDHRGYDFFNKAAENLVEKSCRGKGDLYYIQIAEGILMQKPELISIIDKYKDFLKSISDVEGGFFRTLLIKDFFRNLDKTGVLPQQIELKTIVPDKNALSYIDNTVEYFRARLKL